MNCRRASHFEQDFTGTSAFPPFLQLQCQFSAFQTLIASPVSRRRLAGRLRESELFGALGGVHGNASGAAVLKGL